MRAHMFGFGKKKSTKARDYYDLLEEIQEFLKPQRYVEIGIRHGQSLRLARSAKAAVGIDPMPQISEPLPKTMQVFALTSDDFFAKHDLRQLLNGSFDLAFIDGMHLFEFALRDFINLEKAAAPGATILVHDCYPIDAVTAARERTTDIWSGDVWKLVVCLKKYRPDLQITTVDAPPTGLGIIRGLDAKSSKLSSDLKAICEEFIASDYRAIEANKSEQLNRVDDDWNEIRSILVS